MTSVICRMLLFPILVLAIGAFAPVVAAEDPESLDLIDEGFEGVFPRLPWRVSNAPGSADVDWGRSSHRASDGRWSIYCAGMGTEAPGDGGPAPANTASWAIVGPFDLTDAASGTMSFDLWLETEPYRDVFMWLASVDGERFSGGARSTSTSGWQRVTVNLANWGAAGNVLGEAEVWVAFVYQSDHNNLFEGAYIDDVLLTVDTGTTGDEGRTYTTDADFAEGVMVGVESSSDRLVLVDSWDALPYLWMPNSTTGTVSKVDTDTGAELARYRTGPDAASYPWVAAVDLEGACWVGNRDLGTVVKIGLLENGGCADRDGDGEITTSRDADEDGDIKGSEILDWGEDECALVEVVLVEGLEATHVPGEEHSDYEANGLQALAVDGTGNVWAGVYDSELMYLLDGATGEVLDQVDLSEDGARPTSAVVDANGKIWVSSWNDLWVLGIDPSTGETNRIELGHGSSGLAIGGDGELMVTGWEDNSFTKIDVETESVDWTLPSGWGSSGVALSENGRIWVSSTHDGIVNRYDANGSNSRPVYFVNLSPTGIAVDQAGKIWVAPARDAAIYRINPSSLVREVSKPLVSSGGHDALGDLTGIVARNVSSRYGTWTVVHDSEVAGTPWGRISWDANVPTGTSVRVRVRSSEDQESWSSWEGAGNGLDLGSTPAGRYLEIQASLHVTSGEDLPKLKELTVAPAEIVEAPVAAFSWSPTTPAPGQAVAFSDESTGAPTSWSWDFGDGGTSDAQNPSHSFTDAGTYEVGLTVTNDAGSDEQSQQITVSSGGGCAVTCSAEGPATANLNESVAFTADAEASNCSGDVAFSWSFGDGTTGNEQNPSHAYSTIGTLRWQMTASAGGASCEAAGDITVSGPGPGACDFTYWVPVVSRTNGAAGSVWRSDLGLLGADPVGAAVELRFHGQDPVATRVVTVTPGAMVNLVDVVDWIASGFKGSGALEICADGELVVDSRTYNQLAEDHACFPGASFGQHLAGMSAGGLGEGESARLGLLRESDAFRTNIGLVNTGSEAATVSFELFDATGAELVEYQIGLEPGQWKQDNRPFFERAGRDDLDAASAKVTVVSGGGVVAYASVIDNSTGDATTVPMR